MKPAPRNRRTYSEPTYPKPTTPELNVVERNRKPISGLDTKKMRAITHNAIMWCDHEYGTVLSKSSHRFSARLDMENRSDDVEASFWFQTSPYSNGNLGVHVWYKGELVFNMGDTPGPVYQYPSAKLIVTTYVPGDWEKFLMDKGYHKDKK